MEAEDGRVLSDEEAWPWLALVTIMDREMTSSGQSTATARYMRRRLVR